MVDLKLSFSGWTVGAQDGGGLEIPTLTHGTSHLIVNKWKLISKLAAKEQNEFVGIASCWNCFLLEHFCEKHFYENLEKWL